MRLKNFSLIKRNDLVQLPHAYDLLNATILLSNASEEMALPIGGKKNEITRAVFVEYYATKRLKLTDKIIAQALASIESKKVLGLTCLEKASRVPQCVRSTFCF